MAGNLRYKKLILEYFTEYTTGNVGQILNFMIDHPTKKGVSTTKRRFQIPLKSQVLKNLKSLGGVTVNGQWTLDVTEGERRISRWYQKL